MTSERLPCPSCKLPMVPTRRRNIDLDICVRCQALWFDTGELARLLGREVHAPATDEEAASACPRCSAKLRVARFEGQRAEVCEHGAWVRRAALNQTRGGVEALTGKPQPGLGAKGVVARASVPIAGLAAPSSSEQRPAWTALDVVDLASSALDVVDVADVAGDAVGAAFDLVSSIF